MANEHKPENTRKLLGIICLILIYFKCFLRHTDTLYLELDIIR